ncbi:MAG: YdaU family protein [Thiobacillus sp.]
MAALPYIQLYVSDYLADTAHLTAAQHGAYLLLIMNYWQRGQALNNANERLTNVARMSVEEWSVNKEVLKEFFQIDGDLWTHPRIEMDLEAVRAKSTKASNAGKASAKQKSNKRSTDVQRTFSHTDTDTDTDTNNISDTNVSLVGKESADACPHQKIIDLYHSILPASTQVKVWTGERSSHLRARWREDRSRQNLDWWEKFFTFISESKFLTGRVTSSSGRESFTANLAWIVMPGNFAKIIEGEYHRERAA